MLLKAMKWAIQKPKIAKLDWKVHRFNSDVSFGLWQNLIGEKFPNKLNVNLSREMIIILLRIRRNGIEGFFRYKRS